MRWTSCRDDTLAVSVSLPSLAGRTVPWAVVFERRPFRSHLQLQARCSLISTWSECQFILKTLDTDDASGQQEYFCSSPAPQGGTPEYRCLLSAPADNRNGR